MYKKFGGAKCFLPRTENRAVNTVKVSEKEICPSPAKSLQSSVSLSNPVVGATVAGLGAAKYGLFIGGLALESKEGIVA